MEGLEFQLQLLKISVILIQQFTLKAEKFHIDLQTLQNVMFISVAILRILLNNFIWLLYLTRVF